MKELAAIALALALALAPLFSQDSSASTVGGDTHIYPLAINERHYEIRYAAVGAGVNSIQVNDKTHTVTIDITPFDDGSLQIYVPGGILNSAGMSSSNELIVLVDDQEISPKLLKASCEVELEIPFNSSSKQIDIVGTYVTGSEPLSQGHSLPATVSAGERDYELSAASNADVCDFSFNREEKKIHADLKGPMNEEGYFQVTLPHAFLGGPYIVMADSQLVEYQSVFSERGQHSTTVYFQYEGKDESEVDIIGTTAISEFPAAIWIVAASMLAAAVLTRFRWPQKVL